MTIKDIETKLSSKEYDFLETDKNLGKNIILLGLGGSHAYGTNTESSDLDVRGIAVNRKEEILIVALHLFARDGYEAVSVSQIAGELDITKGALYRHYKSKRDIFDCIVKRMEQQDGEQASDYDMPEEGKERMPEKYETVSFDDFVKYSKSMFEYWTEDDFASSFRKMLTIEQFRSKEMQSLYQQYLVAGPAFYVKDLFESMGITDAKDKAVRFYAILYFYYSLYDGTDDNEKVKEEFVSAINCMVQEFK